MAIEVKVPMLPESITDATVSSWHKKKGDQVSRDENIVDLETDKVMLEVPSPVDGVIKEIKKDSGTTVHAEEVLAIIEEGSKPKKAETKEEPSAKKEPEPKEKKEPEIKPKKEEKVSSQSQALSPSARRAARQYEVEGSHVQGTGKGGRENKEKVSSASSSNQTSKRPVSFAEGQSAARPEKRVPMTRIRVKIAERLLEAKQSTAMLTTFNEIDMSSVMALRKKYRDKFEKRYQTRLGFMSFFVRACVEALKQAPIVNASIDGNDIIYHGYYDIGVAVSTDRGLIVPVLRDADQMSMAEIEEKIIEYAEKAKSGKLSLEEMQGGTFTITNGGVFGSLLATPLLNLPQCAILGMHKIEERPVVQNGQIVIKPMMYAALSYDHRLIDGKESVTFLVSIKEMLEDPTRLILEV